MWRVKGEGEIKVKEGNVEKEEGGNRGKGDGRKGEDVEKVLLPLGEER